MKKSILVTLIATVALLGMTSLGHTADVSGPPSFADYPAKGDYHVVLKNCGFSQPGCDFGTLVDAKGNKYPLPGAIFNKGLAFKKGSNLVITGCDPGAMWRVYWVFDEGTKKFSSAPVYQEQAPTSDCPTK